MGQYYVDLVPRLVSRLHMCCTTILRSSCVLNNPTIWIHCYDQRGSIDGKDVYTKMAMILARMKLADADLSFHTFRRTGVTLAFAHKVPSQAIRAHRVWG